MDLQGAAWLARQYPDFYQCRSPGAAEARKMMQELQVLPADRTVRGVLRDAVAESYAAARSDGYRVCVAVTGERMDLDTVRVPDNGQDITQEVMRMYRSSHFIYGETVETVECRALP